MRSLSSPIDRVCKLQLNRVDTVEYILVFFDDFLHRVRK
jgi:hypothetical protein